jgi:hypothetical protein
VLSDRSLVQSTAPLFRRYLERVAVTYWATNRALSEHPAETRWLLDDYRSHMDNRTLPPGYYETSWRGAEDRFTFLAQVKASYDDNVVDQAVYFWLRRRIDRTDAQVFSMLESLLGAYGMLPGQS